MELDETQQTSVEELSEIEQVGGEQEQWLQQGVEAGIPGMSVPQMPQLPDYSGQAQQAQQAAQQAAQNIAAGTPNAIEQFQTRAGALLKGKSVEEEAEWRAQKQAEYAEKLENQDPNFLKYTICKL